MGKKSKFKEFKLSDGSSIAIIIEKGTLWVTQFQMAKLFDTTRENIAMHLTNIFNEGELHKSRAHRNFLLTLQHGFMPDKTQSKAR